MIKSDSDSKISDKTDPNTASMWGSFSGSFFEAGTVGQGPGDPRQEPGKGPGPVSNQPKTGTTPLEGVRGVSQPVSTAPAVVTCAPISSSHLAATTAPLSVPGECVAPSSSSVLGGEEGLTNSWEEEEDKFSSSRLVVTDRENSTSPDSPSVELVSPSDQQSNQSPSSTTSQELQSVDLASSSLSQSSIDVISPSSVELISPSDVEVISPESDIETDHPALGTLVSVEDSMDLDSSMSSDRTIIDCQETPEQGQGDMQDLLEEAMEDTEKKSETSSSRSSEIVKVESLPVSEVTSCDELDSTAHSSDIEVISSARVGSSASEDSRPELSGDTVELLRKRNKELAELVSVREGRLMAVSREIAQVQEESGEMAVRLQGALEQAKGE